MNNWKETTWGTLATLEYGKSLRGYESAKGKYRVYGTNGPIGWHDESLCTFPSVIIGRKGAYRGVHFSSAPFFVIDTAFYLKPITEFDIKWAYYQLLTQDINGMDSGSAIPSTSREAFYNLPVNLPPLPEQKAIAAVLSSFDDKIELLRRENKTLESIAQTIFKEWFVKFKVNGKKLKIDSKTNLPEGWTQKGLDEIADFLNGLALQKYPPKSEADVLPVIKIRELKAGITDQTDKANKEIASEYIVDDGDVLFSWSGSLEVVLWCYGKGALNQHLFKVTSKKYPKWFYYYWTMEYLPFFKSIAEAKATTMGHIQRHHLAEAKVAVPDNDFMAFANGKIKPVFEKIVLNNSQIQTLSKLRDTLLPKLMKGEIRVRSEKRKVKSEK
jgi:type I restriction enzyme S subunit